MAQYITPAALNAALNYVKDNATELRLVRAYSSGDSYSSVVFNTLCVIAIDTNDFTLMDAAGNGRKFQLASKSGTASAASTGSVGGQNHHWAICGDSEVLKVHNETSNAPIEVGNIVQSPILEATFNQATVI